MNNYAFFVILHEVIILMRYCLPGIFLTKDFAILLAYQKSYYYPHPYIFTLHSSFSTSVSQSKVKWYSTCWTEHGTLVSFTNIFSSLDQYSQFFFLLYSFFGHNSVCENNKNILIYFFLLEFGCKACICNIVKKLKT